MARMLRLNAYGTEPQLCLKANMIRQSGSHNDSSHLVW